MKKHLILAVIAAITLLIILSACGSKESTPDPEITDQTTVAETTTEVSTEAPTTKFDLQSYKDQVTEFKTLVDENVLLLGNVATFELNAGKANGSMDEDFATKGFEWLEKQSGATKADVDEKDEKIRDLYADIIITEIEGKEAEEIDAAVRSLYDAYTTIYKNATTSVGSVNTFANTVSASLKQYDKSGETLDLFLK